MIKSGTSKNTYINNFEISIKYKKIIQFKKHRNLFFYSYTDLQKLNFLSEENLKLSREPGRVA